MDVSVCASACGCVSECLFVRVCMCVCVCVSVRESVWARERGSETSDIFGGCLTISRDPGELHQIIHSFPYISII